MATGHFLGTDTLYVLVVSISWVQLNLGKVWGSVPFRSSWRRCHCAEVCVNSTDHSSDNDPCRALWGSWLGCDMGVLPCCFSQQQKVCSGTMCPLRGLCLLLKSQCLSLPLSLLQLLCFLKTIITGEFLDVCDSTDIKSLKLLNH